MLKGVFPRTLIGPLMASRQRILASWLFAAMSASLCSPSCPAAVFASPEDASVLLPAEVTDPAEQLPGFDANPSVSSFDSAFAADDYFPGTGCTTCGSAGGCGCDTYCDPPGVAQLFSKLHDENKACWVGRADALILWRNAPPDRPLSNRARLDSQSSTRTASIARQQPDHGFRCSVSTSVQVMVWKPPTCGRQTSAVNVRCHREPTPSPCLAFLAIRPRPSIRVM